MRWGLPWPGEQVAVEAEAVGASVFCAGEFADISAYVTAAEMALSTTSAMVGPGIAYAFARSPFVHASSVRHLSKRAPGRVFLGLGAGTARMNSDWFCVDSSHPAPRMAELIEVIRLFLHAENGEKIRYSGDFYRVDADIRAPVFGRLDVPILIGAFNRIMLRTAGRVADGVLGHGLFTDRWWDEVVGPEITAGATAAGRRTEDLKRWGWVITAVNDEDPQRAITDARLQIAFYLTVKTYDSLVELHGWQDQVSAIRTAFRSGDPRSMARHVTDDMLWAIAVCGDSDQAAEMLAARKRLPDTAILAAPSFLVSPRRRAGYDAAGLRLMADRS
ncbi:LLM class flavin-dependent oxidoreductase [Mycolicibacterium thermoresistibile]|uniref:Putative N5, N10-methylenetetrahydromethanopterin reductase-related protein n=1 Tax=Mycolicibacterium thermoresistibile (strain ATCC 19527 / DSM 44167 / CIP 105390 / JCM 6362 / NCTC 10409 / 316) TaxID=1078020 RepID=G7CB96_MYCT3|nr:LLM class flavin-dependent oxidoreductase [Mycolicibacterium thermoresistibile]EHI14750.1 putative N5, N10-methylenetetrahydromethanopterin reductase-related protein [Mycolicibacterium thermoresistibile ATCC 19527]MCV7187375.1 LLM class flavin-dependent oxidoreductase [Mycolicibacterium thermoresistibile]SNW19417.1 5,10-methylenetetrahydromethanopterin reductase [Mycolicibacterium thermoresistibile]